MGDGEVKFSNLSPVMQGILVLLSILGIVVPSVLGFVSFDKRLDIIEVGQAEHVRRDEKRIEKIVSDIDELEESTHALELVDKGLTIQYAEILRQLRKNEESQKNRDREIFDFIRKYDYKPQEEGS
jgi:biopolymer transport protein ExbB/TolQ